MLRHVYLYDEAREFEMYDESTKPLRKQHNGVPKNEALISVDDRRRLASLQLL